MVSRFNNEKNNFWHRDSLIRKYFHKSRDFKKNLYKKKELRKRQLHHPKRNVPWQKNTPLCVLILNQKSSDVLYKNGAKEYLAPSQKWLLSVSMKIKLPKSKLNIYNNIFKL